MLVIIKSAPETTEGKRGVSLARDMSADIVLLQNAVYFQGRKLANAGFTGKTYVIEDDRLLRGLKKDAGNSDTEYIDYDGLVDLIDRSESVKGMF
jgi:sulfur relay protein TusB/DsrH